MVQQTDSVRYLRLKKVPISLLITFLDTPGHAAFSKIRERGANLTDVSVLVVAADDGFMPQTDEALKFAQRAQGTLVVAINKMDTKGADADKVKTQMQERSIPSEDWGGEVVTVPISALKGDGVEELLDMILLQAELMELKANPDANKASTPEFSSPSSSSGIEALKGSLEMIASDKVILEILQSEVGQITKNDVKMAKTSGADVVGFNVKMENGVMGEAKHLDVRVFQNNIIYEIIDLVKDNMAELLEPELVEKKTGRAEVRQVFKVSKGRAVAGSMIMEGSIVRNKVARLSRNGEVLSEGKIDTLKRFKDDVTEVKAGFECGIRLDSFNDYEEGDVIETFEVEKIRPSL